MTNTREKYERTQQGNLLGAVVRQWSQWPYNIVSYWKGENSLKTLLKEGTGGSANCLPEPKQRDDKAGKTNCGGAEHPGQGDLHFGGGGQGEVHLGGGQQPCHGGGGRGGVRHPPLPHQDGQFEELKIATVLKDNTYCSPFKHNDQGVYKYRL